MLVPSPRTYRGLLRAANGFHDVDVDWTPGAQSVLVLAPHMDDEVLGCGGTLVLHRRAGALVTVVFVTDGRWGSGKLHGLDGDALRQAQERLIATRRREAAAALTRLDIEAPVFLDAPDGALAPTPELAGRLRAVIERVAPQIVYLPSFLEQHPDHRATNDVLRAALRGERSDIACHGYEVWTPQYPNCFVGIDATMDVKLAALAEYHSQLEDGDFQHGIVGLNAYRAMMRPRPGRRYAEAFCALPLPDYFRAYDVFRGVGVR